MTQHPLRRFGGLLLTSALCGAVLSAVPAAPATAAPKALQPPACTRPAEVKATTLKADDNDAGKIANKARVADIEARWPDRQLSPYSQENEIGEGWRYAWKGGQQRYVAFLNRQGAMLTGTAFAPDPSRCPGRRPAVLLTEGITANEVLYWWQAQSLAEAGYVVLTFDYMNQGLSEAAGHAADGTPIPPVGGERGSDPATGFLQDAQDALDFLLSTPATPYEHQGPALASDAPFDRAFPYAGQVDPRYVGLTGHSEGARVASVLQGIDSRVGALVALDNLASRLKGDPGSSNSQCVEGGIGTDTMAVTPRVPAMGQAAPNNTVCDDPELKKFAYETWRTAGIPAVQAVVALAKHGDWAPNPTIAEGNESVPELAAFWTIAWFDRWLLRDADAEVRFFTRTFDLFDHYTGPLTLPAADVYDTAFTSSAATGTNNCVDLRAGCPVLRPMLSTKPSGPGHDDRNADEDPDTGARPDERADDKALGTGAAPSGPGARPAPGAPAPVTSGPLPAVPFVPVTAAATSAPGAGALAALPLAGVLLGLAVLVGYRRHEGVARRLGVLAP